MVVTFIITLVCTGLITYIITSMYYKHMIDCIKKSVIIKESDPHDNIKKSDPAFATNTINNVTMDTNPAYGTVTTIQMDTNPVYATTTH